MTKVTARTEASTRRGTRTPPTALRTIQEVSEELDVAAHVLRFWESKFPQLRPLKRSGGERHYRPEDIDILRCIRWLLYEEGHTIRGAQKLLRRRGAHPDETTDVDRGGPGEAAPAAETAEEMSEEDWLQAELVALRREAKARAASLDAIRGKVEAACDRLLAG